MKDQNTLKAEEKAQKILEILDCGANSRQWSELVELLKEAEENSVASFIHNTFKD